MCYEIFFFEKMVFFFDIDFNLSFDSIIVDGFSMLFVVDEGIGFIRCSILFMSLFK